MRPIIAIVLLLIGASLVLLQCRRMDPARRVQQVSYPVRCQNCKTAGRLTTAEMNRMIARGEVISLPEQMRQFLCRSCGQTNLILDQSQYFELITNTPKRVHAN